MATTSISLRSASTAARRTLRPMRPNPLMATRTDIFPVSLTLPQVGRSGSPPPQNGQSGSSRYYVFTTVIIEPTPFRPPYRRSVRSVVKVLVGRTGAKPGHPDKSSLGSNDAIPALADAGFDRDIELRPANDR